MIPHNAKLRLTQRLFQALRLQLIISGLLCEERSNSFHEAQARVFDGLFLSFNFFHLILVLLLQSFKKETKEESNQYGEHVCDVGGFVFAEERNELL